MTVLKFLKLCNNILWIKALGIVCISECMTDHTILSYYIGGRDRKFESPVAVAQFQINTKVSVYLLHPARKLEDQSEISCRLIVDIT